MPLEILLSGGRFDAARLEREPHIHDDPHAFSTWSYETEQPLSLEALREVAARLPVSIYRCKGVVRSAEAPDRRAVLQVVGKRVDIWLEDAWGNCPPRTRIVAIGADRALGDATLRETFDHCLR